ncbi:MAG: aspartyl protease family protein [Bacteroidota bacterium]
MMNHLKKIHFLIAFLATIGGYAQSTNPVAQIPFELSGEHVFLQLTINDSEQLDFIFDTGAGATVINSETATRLNFVSNKTSTATGASGETQSSIIKNKSIELGSIKLEKMDLVSVPLEHLEKTMGKDIDGIIGYGLLEKYVTEINYHYSKLILYESKSYDYQGNGEVVSLKIKNNLPMATFQVILKEGSYVDEKFMLDTGAGLAMGFTAPFARKSQIKNKIGKTYSSTPKGISTSTTQVEVGKIKKLKLANFEFENIPANIYDIKTGFFASKEVAGIIGNEILRKFNITFDYKGKKSYWVKNKYFDEAFYIQNSGLKLSFDADKSKVIIRGIIPNSSAEESELKAGDEIVEIDGVKASESSLEALRKLLATQSGKKVKIKYRRAGEVKEILLSLKPLI